MYFYHSNLGSKMLGSSVWGEGGKKVEKEGKYTSWQENKWPTCGLAVANCKQVVGSSSKVWGKFPCSSYNTVHK